MIPLFQSSGAEPDSQALQMTFVNHSLQQMPPALSSSDVMPQIPGARRERRREITLSTSSMASMACFKLAANAFERARVCELSLSLIHPVNQIKLQTACFNAQKVHQACAVPNA